MGLRWGFPGLHIPALPAPFIYTENISTFLNGTDALVHTLDLLLQLCLMKHADFLLFGSGMCVM